MTRYPSAGLLGGLAPIGERHMEFWPQCRPALYPGILRPAAAVLEGLL